MEPDDHPASITPYTAMDERARKNSTPTGGSATCRYVVSPNQVTVPSPEKSPPMGTMENTRKAGTSDRYGANLKTTRSALSGIRSSLKNSLMPSASVWRMPNGPASAGPIRLCMSATSLRSNQIMSITDTSSRVNASTTLMSTMPTMPGPMAPSRRGSAARTSGGVSVAGIIVVPTSRR